MISLKELLENHENENIEFKESFIKLSKDFWPTYSAFANTAQVDILFWVLLNLFRINTK